jgi:hypothetical protein
LFFSFERFWRSKSNLLPIETIQSNEISDDNRYVSHGRLPRPITRPSLGPKLAFYNFAFTALAALAPVFTFFSLSPARAIIIANNVPFALTLLFM